MNKSTVPQGVKGLKMSSSGDALMISSIERNSVRKHFSNTLKWDSDRNSTKPIFELESPDLISFTCIFDTGADTPAWC